MHTASAGLRSLDGKALRKRTAREGEQPRTTLLKDQCAELAWESGTETADRMVRLGLVLWGWEVDGTPSTQVATVSAKKLKTAYQVSDVVS
jgi:hypothetical protein